jgi:dihydrofolate reductase
MISIIAALDTNNLIGSTGTMPWHLPADLRYFKECTVGKPVIMGYKTYQSIGKPLPDRTNIVLSELVEEISGCIVVHSVTEALHQAGEVPEIMIIGGRMVYKHFLSHANRMYLTRIDHAFEGDVYFPEYNKEEWHEVSCEPHIPDEKNLYPYAFIILERKHAT